MTKYRIKPSEVFFFLAGIFIIASLPWLDGPAISFWVTGKAFYFVGILFFIFKR